ncbi:uncharacterized protein EHS24_003788 [Apiotrichum porosum]|uniref:Cytochrome b5 heme-binding domain-containing protein n=1 Tax=Apiotrichum porosum TaxID=105984 RepID=A0A427XEK9_9TREE|nr:uncharacterized protein EHS24_003788 [Apiotrichum porosum]RSH77154.1 hypothetical protein EHS24_003788 [Apiotrichum porosum]
MGFSRFHLPTDYLAEREKHGLGLPAGAVQLGEFTVTLEPPPDLLEYIDKNTPKEEGGALPMLTHEQIATHVDEDHGIWIVIDDLVLDVTVFREVHPGGTHMFDKFAGKQCGWQFRGIHPPGTLDKWRGMLVIGRTTPLANEYEDRGDTRMF